MYPHLISNIGVDVMRSTRLIASIAAAFLIGAGCAAGPQPAGEPVPAAVPAPVFDPVGMFDFTTSVEGQSFAGVIQIRRTEAGSLTATLSTDVTGSIPLPRVTITEQRLTLSGDTPDGQLTVNMDMRGAEFTGNWTMGGLAGSLTGRRRS
jgi:hypothetical protein